jgi:hypothetical protein
MGGVCSTYGGKGDVSTVFWWGGPRERDRWGDRVVDGRIMLGCIFKKWDVVVKSGLGWLGIEIRCRALVSAVRNLRVP